MKKYKIVVSDLHIGRGRWLEDGSLNPLESFIYDEKFIQFLEYYSSGDFQRAEVELILNGDFLNTIQTDYREEFPKSITEEGSLLKVKQIIEGHKEIFEALKKFANTPHHSITYLYGNHEPGLLWKGVRDYLNQVLETEINYPGFSYAFDGIYIEHGQQHQAANRFNLAEPFLTKGLAEPVLNLPWGSYFVINFLNKLKHERPYIDRVQPFGRYLVAALVFDTGFAIKSIIRLLIFFINQQFSWSPEKKRPIGLMFAILKEISIIPPLEITAKEILKKGLYHTVIFGHNHQPAYRKVGETQLYVNTGTWNDIIHLDIANLGRQRRMTYAFIEYDKKGNPITRLKIWKGTRFAEEDVIF